MGNVPQPTSIIDDTRASSLSNGNYNGARVKKTSTASSQKAERIDRVSYRNRGCRSCFSVHDPRRPIEKQLGNTHTCASYNRSSCFALRILVWW